MGIPNTLATRQDYQNTYEYVQQQGNVGLKHQFRDRLIALKQTRYMNVLKSGVSKSEDEDYTPEDFEAALDPASMFIKSGLIEDEIDQMIGALQ